jgi:Polysaccharide biosynthesis enzyme WcbI
VASILGKLRRKFTTGQEMTQIVVTSNCQTHGIASSLQLMIPKCKTLPVWTLSGLDYVVEEISSKATEDFIWLTILTRDQQNSVLERLSVRPSKILEIPEIFFDAFHPDMTYVQLTNGALQESALGHYHSRISLWCFLNGLSTEQCLKLFNGTTYQSLGYFGKHEHALEELRNDIEKCGLDMAPLKRILTHKDAFMHTFNHPKLSLLAALSQSIIFKLELPTVMQQEEVSQVLRDVLLEAGPIYPIYPEIAEFFGVEGSYYSRRQDGRILSLFDFTYESFEIYKRIDNKLFNSGALFSDQFEAQMRTLVEQHG